MIIYRISVSLIWDVLDNKSAEIDLTIVKRFELITDEVKTHSLGRNMRFRPQPTHSERVALIANLHTKSGKYIVLIKAITLKCLRLSRYCTRATQITLVITLTDSAKVEALASRY